MSQKPAVIEEDQFASQYKKIITNFVKDLDYVPPNTRGADFDISSSQTYQSLLSEFSPYGTRAGWVEATCLAAASSAELPYPEHPVEVKLLIARFTWYLLYMDDLGHKDPASLKTFQHSMLTKQTSERSILEGLRKNLADMSDHWNPIAANCITVAGMDFITGRLMEMEPSIRDMKSSTLATSWPNYLRVKTGASPGYAFFIYPTASVPDLSTYIQMIEDIRFFIDYANDVLSFYKEALVGETNNYIHYRAEVTGKEIVQTIQDVANEVVDTHSRISQALESTKASKPWKLFANGLLDFHFATKRYRLSDLGF
ncbi:isoprenoid synthase domain-containing protein [Gymnopilus junonius]|uniref:Isoprenoid synthase domain-containing protein n=1 Tax=Gymnopilus junonius TaxID=109634 RepID=A0A9P5NLP8_GYMJU|nr:isoprenoid synthase domain-containing protein [Gymnopilus junonius]